jgi:catechol 2,3-dioxygenase-like lactoylglutathione lyase family enzyme
VIIGAHVILYSQDADADKAFFRDVLGFPAVDAGRDWLIFALPPSELAVHPAEVGGGHELYLMCDDVAAEVGQLEGRGVSCSRVEEQGWGAVTQIQLPGGSTLGLYEPHHPSPHPTA